MKYFQQLFSFIILFTILCNQSATAGDDDFCSDTGAEAQMQKLEAENATKFEKIRIYKEEIAELVASDKLINSIKDLKNRYIDSVSKISDLQNRPDLLEFIGYLKTIKFDGEVLEGMNANSPRAPTHIVPRELVHQSQGLINSLRNKIGKHTQANINEVINQIPESISPRKVRAIMKNNSPTIDALLEKNISKKDLTTCLRKNAKVDDCTKIGISPAQKVNLVATLTAEYEGLSNQLSKNPPIQNPTITDNKSQDSLINIIKDAQSVIDNSVEALFGFTFPSAPPENSESPASGEQNSYSKADKAREQIARNEKQLKGAEVLFYRFSVNMEAELRRLNVDMDTQEGALRAIEIQQNYQDQAVEDSAKFKKNCNFLDKDSKTVGNDQVNSCISLIKKIVDQVVNLNQSHLFKINELNSKIKQLVAEDNFGDIEELKKYVAEKYMCSCNKDKKTLSINKENESLVLKGESCQTEFLSLSKIEGLSSASSSIANALYANEIKVPMDDGSCSMDSLRLAPTVKTCTKNKYINSNYSDICKQVIGENEVKVDNEKINTKWESYNKKNYIEYDSSSPHGYKAEKKKGKWRIFGEGILPVIPNALPMWLNNFQIQNNISMLTTQAMMQKQYLHNAGVFNQSPWMNNYSSFGYGNPFATTPNSLSGQSSSNGFNFGL